MPSLKLKRGVPARALQGHPWVFATEVQKLLLPEHDGEVVECRDAEGRLIGSGLYNSRSKIVWRRFSQQRAVLDQPMLETLLQQAIERRDQAEARRLVWSESDDLPGLVVDQYANTLVIQTLTVGMEKRQDEIVQTLVKLLSPQSVMLRNDVPSRRLEGLDEEVRCVYGNEPQPQWVRIGRVDFFVDVVHGQKTGFYLDQQKEYEFVSSISAGKRVLDVCCHVGGFALHASASGASRALGVDISADAIEKARQHASHNRLSTEFVCANAFDFLKQHQEIWDVIILDPPPFAKGRDKVADALRGYKEMHLKAFKLLAPKSKLVTYCCSHHVKREVFMQMIAEAATDARRRVTVQDLRRQPLDHPVSVFIPESDYLYGFVLAVD